MGKFAKRLEFLKPTIGKVALFLLLMGGLNLIYITNSNVFDARVLFGLPFGFYSKGSHFLAYGPAPDVTFSITNFAFDIVFWYVLASTMVIAWRDQSRRTFALALAPLVGTFLAILVSRGIKSNPYMTFIFVMLGYAFLVGIYKCGDLAPSNNGFS